MSRSYRPTNTVQQEEQLSDECFSLYSVALLQKKVPSIDVVLQVESKDITMQVDTGASLTIISEHIYRKLFNHVKLSAFQSKITTYTGEPIVVHGYACVNVRYKGQQAVLPLVVVAGDGPSLLGRHWLTAIRLDWYSINNIPTVTIEDILMKYSDVFEDSLCKYNGPPVKFVIDPEAQPRFFKARPVPYAIKNKVQEAIEKNVELGIWEAVDYSDWAAPVVPVLKTDGTIRLCGDYKVTINQACKVDPYPLPRIEDIFAELRGGEEFTKIDLHKAYSQIPVDEEYQRYLIVNTHMGLFKVKRLSFGVNAVVGCFQRIITNVLKGLKGVIAYIDDILVTGSDSYEHLVNVELVLERLRQAGLQVNKDKCYFMQPSVEYLGHRIDAEGLHPIPTKVKAVKEAPTPANKTELRSFLGLINYYSRFLRNLSTELAPLYELTKKDVSWKWGKREEKVFNFAKDMISTSDLLVHYNPQLPLLVQCDASPRGIGCVLSHRYADGTDRPIAFASRSLNSAEINYSQIDREALALVFGVTKFHQYLYGRTGSDRFILVTDHKPLTYLFGHDSTIPVMASARVQRWALTLSAYNYIIEYKRGVENANADALSRLPLPDQPQCPSLPQEMVSVVNMIDSAAPIVSSKEIRIETQRDRVLSKVFQWVRWGWPGKVDKCYDAFYTRREEISIMDGCLLWGNRIIVPSKCRDAVLGLLHDTHIGMSRMKATGRSYVWWPGMDQDIEATVRECPACDKHQNSPATAELHPWEWPSSPWSRVHIDHAGPFMGKLFLIVIDAHSKWLEVIHVPNTSTHATIIALSGIFATHGLPVTLVSDNGTSFTSDDFQRFCTRHGIKHIRSAPRHPSTNGLAERAVQTFKSSIMKMGNNIPWEMRVNKFLFKYRTTHQSTTQETPSQLLMNRCIRTPISMLQADLRNRVETKQVRQAQDHDRGCKTRVFTPGDKVFTHCGGSKVEWLPGIIEAASGPLSYVIRLTDGRTVKRHVDHIRERHVDIPDPLSRSYAEPEMQTARPGGTTSIPAAMALPDDRVAPDAAMVPPDMPPAPDMPVPSPEKQASPIVPPVPRTSGRVRRVPDSFGLWTT